MFKKNFANIIRKLQKDIIKVFKMEYNELITINDILLLNSSGKVPDGYKISLHIIVSPEKKSFYYTNSKFTESSAYHFYTSLINLNENYKDLLDPQVYNTDINFRIIESYKNFNDNRCLLPIDPETYETIDVDDDSKIDYLLTYIKRENKKLITPIIEQTITAKKYISLNKPSTTDICEDLFKKVQKYHATAIYQGLYSNIYHSFNYTNRKEKCPISGNLHDSNGFYVIENDRGHYLKCHSNKCNGSIHIGYPDETTDFIKNAKQINKRFLIREGGIDDEPKEHVKNWIKEWLEYDKIKTLAIRSAMGTGKTTMIQKILEYDKSIKKILWITHRQTLTKQIFGIFSKFGFKNYMNMDGNLFKYDRIIVQIDSLMRIKEYDDENNILLRQYDLVIMDEIEGNLNHYHSPFINKPNHTPRELFRFMVEVVDSASKLLLLDADLGMRSNLFMQHFGTSIFINNFYKPVKKTFCVTNDYNRFDKQLFKDIKRNKNICVVSMSATALELIEIKLKRTKIKYVLHTNKTDDKLKNRLENVNDFWSQYQIVLYSPTIESGIDFNKKHFHKIYAIIKSGQLTTSQRGFLQMIGRIRQVSDPKILCYYDGYTKTNSRIYTYDDVLSYFRYYEELNGKKMMENIIYRKETENGLIKLVREKSDISLFDHISIYNEVEQLNKNSHIFMTVLNKLIQRMGDQLEFDLVDKTIKNKIESVPIEDIIADIDETKYNIKQLIKKQGHHELNKEEKLVVKKYFFMKTFGIKNARCIEEFKRFYKKFHTREIHIRRFEKFFGYKTIYENDIDNIDDGKDKSRHKIIIDILNRLTGNDNYDDLDDIMIISDNFNDRIEDIANYSIFFGNQEKNRLLLFIGAKLPFDLKNNARFFS